MGETGRWPRVLVVTDRRRLVERMGAAPADWPALLQSQIAGALAGGADLVQVREPDLEAAALVRMLRNLFATLPGSAGRVVINDRADVARVTGAAGVHLAERSMAIGEARALQPPGAAWVIGRSVHDPATAAASRAADYLIAGTVQPSVSKSDAWRLLGWAGLSAIVRAAGDVPVLAIGGLGPDQAGDVRRAGAAGVAGIGCFLPIQGQDMETSVQERVHAMRMAFDRA